MIHTRNSDTTGGIRGQATQFWWGCQMGMAHGAWRGLVTIVELIDPGPYRFYSPVYRRLIYTVVCMSDCLSTQENPNLHLTPPRDLRRANAHSIGSVRTAQESQTD